MPEGSTTLTAFFFSFMKNKIVVIYELGDKELIRDWDVLFIPRAFDKVTFKGYGKAKLSDNYKDKIFNVREVIYNPEGVIVIKIS